MRTNMLKGIKLSFLLVLIALQSVHAQTATEGDSLVIPPNVKMIVEAENPAIFPQEYHFFIEAYQNNQLSVTTKERLLKALIALDQKKVRIRYDIKELLDGLKLAKEERNFSQESMENLAYSIQKAAEAYDRIQLNYYFETLYTFLKHEAIYKDRYQSISFRNAEYEVLFSEDNYNAEEPIVYQESEPVDVETLRAQARGEYEEPEQVVTDPFTEPMLDMYKELGSVIHLKRGDLILASQSDTFEIIGTEGFFLFDQKLLLQKKILFYHQIPKNIYLLLFFVFLY